MKYFFTLLIVITYLFSFSQEEVIAEKITENGFVFSSIDSQLTQIAGAPEPFYTYWWEFGDGHYSTEKSPTHYYDSKGDFNMLLARTNNYDDGPSRPTQKKKISNDSQVTASLNLKDTYLEKNEILSLTKNHNPKPNEEIIFVQTYKNSSTKTQKGTLVFFYNEKAFEEDHFVLADYRNHFQEKEFAVTKNILLEKINQIEDQNEFSSSIFNEDYYNRFMANQSNEYLELVSSDFGKDTDENNLKYFNSTKNIKKEISEAYLKYKNVIAFEFDELKAEDERNIFMSFNTTNEMLKDTNVSISIQSIFIPEDYEYATRVRHIMPIVTAHDPNKLIVNKNITYKTFSKKKALEYEIKFQNVGKGPAEEVKLRFYNNAEIDVESIEILDFEPKCQICSENCSGSYIDTSITKDYIEFHFHNIYLPGTRQSDIEKRDASKGFVKFSLKTKKKIKQNNITCRTEIYFDKEDPIRTNNSKTRFQKRIYFGVEVGTNYQPIQRPKFDLFVRGTFTLRLSKRWYYKTALAATYIPNIQTSFTNAIDTNFVVDKYGYALRDPDSVLHIIDPVDSLSLSNYNRISNSNLEIRKQSISMQVIPIEIRREISEYFSIGFGVSTIFNVASFEKRITDYKIEEYETTVDSDIDFVAGPAGNGYTSENFRISNPKTSLINSNEDRIEEKFNNNGYEFDMLTGLFLDVNIGRIHSIPYFGARANFDYRLSTQKFNPSIQFYLGANF